MFEPSIIVMQFMASFWIDILDLAGFCAKNNVWPLKTSTQTLKAIGFALNECTVIEWPIGIAMNECTVINHLHVLPW